MLSNDESTGKMRSHAVLWTSFSEAENQEEEEDRLTLRAVARALVAAQLDVTLVDMSGASEAEVECSPDVEELRQSCALKFVGPPELKIFGEGLTHERSLRALELGEFDVIHGLDRGGLLGSAVVGRDLGTALFDTTLVTHVVGGAFYRRWSSDEVISDASILAEDVVECRSVAMADYLVVHDRHALQWWTETAAIKVLGEVAFVNEEDERAPSRLTASSEVLPEAPMLTFWGPLSIAGGLSVFADVVDQLHKSGLAPSVIRLVGRPSPVGGRDSMSYLYARAASWRSEVELLVDRSLDQELALLGEGPIFVANHRREHLRARILTAMGVDEGGPVVLVDGSSLAPQPTEIASVIGGRSSNQSKSFASASASYVEAIGRAVGIIAPGSVPPLVAVPEVGQPKVSVCVVHHERPDKLREALESLRSQTYRNFDVTIIDDGSVRESTVAALAQIESSLPASWKLIRQSNRYLGAARNAAAESTDGEFLLFMDDDNVACPEEIETLVAAAIRAEADIVTCHLFSFSETVSEPRALHAPLGADNSIGWLKNAAGDANALVRRGCWNELVGFVENYGVTHEDWEFLARANLEGHKLVTVPVPLFNYRIDEQGMLRGSKGELRRSSDLRVGIGPFVDSLPYDQAKVLLLLQGLYATHPGLQSGGVALSVASTSTSTRCIGDISAAVGTKPFGRVAVVCRTKNRPVLLDRAIKSLCSQTYGDWLLVIVNDGGDPDLVDAVVAYNEEPLSGRVHVVHNSVSLGMQSASNVGFDASSSDFIAVHDDDDTWEPEFLERCVGHLDSNGWNPKLAGVVTWATAIIEELDGENPPKTLQSYLFHSEDFLALSLRDLSVENRFPPICLLATRSAFDDVGPFMDSSGPLGDWDFHLKLLSKYDIDVIPEPLANYHHRRHTVGGPYGNSVHAQQHEHKIFRQRMLNDAIRRGEGPLPALLSLGDMQHTLQQEMGESTQALSSQIEQLGEEMVTRMAEASEPLRVNLIQDGEFYHWPHSELVKCEERATALSETLLLSHNGSYSDLTVELKRDGDPNDERAPHHWLEVVNASPAESPGTFLHLSVRVPLLLASGQPMTYGFYGSLDANLTKEVRFTGSLQPRKDEQIALPVASYPLGFEWEYVAHTFIYPKVDPSETNGRPFHRLSIKLPVGETFTFRISQLHLAPGTSLGSYVPS